MEGSSPGFSVHGIFQARILEWVAIAFSRGSSWPRDQTWVSCVIDGHLHGRWILDQLSYQESPWNVALGWNLKNNRTISVHFKGKSFNVIVIQAYAPTTDAEGEVHQFFENTASSRINTKRKENTLFITGIWNGKVGSQEISGVMGKFGLAVQNEVGQRLTEFCQENMLVIVCFQTT